MFYLFIKTPQKIILLPKLNDLLHLSNMTRVQYNNPVLNYHGRYTSLRVKYLLSLKSIVIFRNIVGAAKQLRRGC